MKTLGFLVIWLGLGGLVASASYPLTPPEALQILKDYFAQEKEWWVEMGKCLTLNKEGKVLKSSLTSQKLTIKEYLYRHYQYLRMLDEAGLVTVKIEDDSNSKVARYKYSVQPTPKLLESTPWKELPSVWHFGTFDQIEVVGIKQVGGIVGCAPSQGATVTYSYRLTPSVLGKAIGLSEKNAQDVRQIIRSGNGWKVNDYIRKMI